MKTWLKLLLRKTPRSITLDRCRAVSGFMFGYRCDQRDKHDPPHEATIEITHNQLGGEIGRKVIRW